MHTVLAIRSGEHFSREFEPRLSCQRWKKQKHLLSLKLKSHPVVRYLQFLVERVREPLLKRRVCVCVCVCICVLVEIAPITLQTIKHDAIVQMEPFLLDLLYIFFFSKGRREMKRRGTRNEHRDGRRRDLINFVGSSFRVPSRETGGSLNKTARKFFERYSRWRIESLVHLLDITSATFLLLLHKY